VWRLGKGKPEVRPYQLRILSNAEPAKPGKRRKSETPAGGEDNSGRPEAKKKAKCKKAWKKVLRMRWEGITEGRSEAAD